jgi:hypothetical protein
MKADMEVQSLIEKVEHGQLGGYHDVLVRGDLGIYIPCYAYGNEVRKLTTGYSQTETNLRVEAGQKSADRYVEGSQPVAWFADPAAVASECRHEGTSDCFAHCMIHPAQCCHCSKHDCSHIRCEHRGAANHEGKLSPHELDAPELDYEEAISSLRARRDVLECLSREGFGLALLHGHNSIYKFTRLPPGYVAVISNGVTCFRKLSEVSKDASFVPNMWRFLGTRLQPAGGFSSV